MTTPPDKLNGNDDEFAAILAHFDKALAEEQQKHPLESDAAPPELKSRLVRMKALLERLEQDRRRAKSERPAVPGETVSKISEGDFLEPLAVVSPTGHLIIGTADKPSAGT